MSTLKTHNLQSADSGSVNIALTANAGMIVTGISTFNDRINIGSLGVTTNFTVAGISTFSGQLNVGSNIKLGNAGVITATSFVGSGANLTSLPAANLTGTLPAISGANLTSLPSQLTLSNNADNRVITGGSGVNLNGEANLTFDGSHLTLANGKGIRTNYIRPTSNGNTNTGNTSQQYWKIGDISLNGSEAAEITLLGSSGYSSGNAQVYGKTTIILRGSNGNTLLGSWWVDGGEASHYSDVRWKYTSGTTYELWVSSGAYNNLAPFVRTTGTFDQTNAAGTGTNTPPSGSTALQQTHYKSVGTIHTIQYTSTHTRFLQNIKMDSGKGISFINAPDTASGETVSNSVLDDYEEGSFTPTYSNTGGVTPAYNYREGLYTKIGNMVTCAGIIGCTNANSFGSNMQIRIDLPFTCAANTFGMTGGSLSDGAGWQNVTSNSYQVGPLISGGVSYGRLVTLSSSPSNVYYTGTPGLQNSHYFRFRYTYPAA